MRLPPQQDTTEPGHDSFLDIVANIVGILIILVMVTGLRVQKATVEAAATDQTLQAEAGALEKDRATANSLRRDVLDAAGKVQQLARERLLRQQERDRLATLVAAWEHEIESRRSQLDGDARQVFDHQVELSRARDELESLGREHAAVQAADVPIIRVESLPTPLSKPVDGQEAHFQLRGGQVAFIPLEELLKQFKEDARVKARTLLEQPELTNVVGPVGGFRLRYTLVRRQITDETAIAMGRAGTYATLSRWTLIPVSGELGEPIEVALGPSSRFRSALAQFHPARATVTIWTYPDSFAEFRQLKKELYRLGFATAARPLPHGAPIGGSPEGTKSAAE